MQVLYGPRFQSQNDKGGLSYQHWEEAKGRFRIVEMMIATCLQILKVPNLPDQVQAREGASLIVYKLLSRKQNACR